MRKPGKDNPTTGYWSREETPGKRIPQPEGVDSCSGRREFSGEDVGSLLSDVLQFNHRGGTLFGSARLEPLATTPMALQRTRVLS